MFYRNGPWNKYIGVNWIVEMHWILLHPPSRLFHGVEGEPPLDSSLLTIRLADERKPKPPSAGNHQMNWLSRMVNSLIAVISAELKMPRTFKDWNLATTSLTTCWPSPGSRAGGELSYLWWGPKTSISDYNLVSYLEYQMGSPFNKATSTTVPAPGQQGDKQGHFSEHSVWHARRLSSIEESQWVTRSGTTTRLISRKEQELAKCNDMAFIPIIIFILIIHITIIILARCYTMPKRSMRAWRLTGRNQKRWKIFVGVFPEIII